MDLTSIRTKDNKVKLSFFAEDSLRYILGSYYNHWHGYNLKEKEWKHILEKLSSKIEVAINLNLSTDYIHREEIQFYLDSLKRNINDKANSDPDIIIALIALCFELLGGLPNNTGHRHANKENYFNLTAKRSIHFLQDNHQKARVILESARHSPFNEFYNYDDLISKLSLDFKGKHKMFIDWYKSKYPELYAKIF